MWKMFILEYNVVVRSYKLMVLWIIDVCKNYIEVIKRYSNIIYIN